MVCINRIMDYNSNELGGQPRQLLILDSPIVVEGEFITFSGEVGLQKMALRSSSKKKRVKNNRDIEHVKIPKPIIERFTRRTIQRNKRLFERLSKA